MKQLLTLLLLFSCLASISQSLTYVPDDTFENYLENNNMGDGIMGNNHVLTSNIQSVEILDVDGLAITDFTGIEDFSALKIFSIQHCNASSLDLSENFALEGLNCRDNNITYLNLNNSHNLTVLTADNNQLLDLDVSQCPLLVKY